MANETVTPGPNHRHGLRDFIEKMKTKRPKEK